MDTEIQVINDLLRVLEANSFKNLSNEAKNRVFDYVLARISQKPEENHEKNERTTPINLSKERLEEVAGWFKDQGVHKIKYPIKNQDAILGPGIVGFDNAGHGYAVEIGKNLGLEHCYDE